MNKIGRKLYLKEMIDVFKHEQHSIQGEFVIKEDNFKQLMTMKENNIHIATINQAHKKNAQDINLMKEIYSYFIKEDIINGKTPLIFIGDKTHSAFSSGADLKSWYNTKMDEQTYWSFFNISYYVFYLTQQMKVNNFNYICIWNGIVMGGGVGISMNAKIRIATESTIFAMPESMFGYFANCVFSDFIGDKLNKKETLHMTLASDRYYGYEVYEKKIATHFVLNKYIKEMIGDIRQKGTNTTTEEINAIINIYQNKSLNEYETEINRQQKKLKQKESFIKQTYTEGSFDFLYNKLISLGSTQEEINLSKEIKRRSIHSLRLNYGIAQAAFDTKLDYESRFNIDVDYSEIIFQTKEFIEGIRAYFIDKDNSPKWPNINTLDRKKYNYHYI